MLKRDFIMVQIEELGKVIAQIIFNRNSNDGARKNPELIQSVYTSLKLDNDFLLNTPIDGIRTYLDGDDSCGLQRMELATKTLLEESFLLPEAQGNKPSNAIMSGTRDDTAFFHVLLQHRIIRCLLKRS